MQKAALAREVILGAGAVGVDEIAFMPDYLGLGYYTTDKVADKISAKISFLDMPATNTQEDSTLANKMMNEMNVACVLVIGGDGTNRAVANGFRSTSILLARTRLIGRGDVLLEEGKISRETLNQVVSEIMRDKLERGTMMVKLKKTETLTMPELTRLTKLHPKKVFGIPWL